MAQELDCPATRQCESEYVVASKEEKIAMGMEGKLLTETRFLTVVDTYAGFCQVCHNPRVVARMAVAGWEHHGTICSQCLTVLADEVQRRGKGQADETASKMRSDETVLVAIVEGNGSGHARASQRH